MDRTYCGISSKELQNVLFFSLLGLALFSGTGTGDGMEIITPCFALPVTDESDNIEVSDSHG
jgi:hypothetical protein